MKNKLVVLLAAFAVAISAASTFAAETTVEGTVSGYTCAVLGKACPVDREDPVIAAEKVFVVVKTDGSFYMVPNVDRAILARHITEKVRVKGTVDEKYKSIKASSLSFMSKGAWKETWSKAMEDEMEKLLTAP